MVFDPNMDFNDLLDNLLNEDGESVDTYPVSNYPGIGFAGTGYQGSPAGPSNPPGGSYGTSNYGSPGAYGSLGGYVAQPGYGGNYGDPSYNVYTPPSTPAPSGPSAAPTTPPGGNTYGIPDWYAKALQDAAALAENQRQAQARETLDQQKFQLEQQKFAWAQRAAAGDPAAAGQLQQVQHQLDGLDAQRLQLEQNKLAADQLYREQTLAQQAAQAGMSQQEIDANIALSRDKLNQAQQQFEQQFGFDWMKNQQAVDQFNAKLGQDYLNSGNQLLYNTWATQQQNDTTRQGQEMNYALGTRGQDMSYGSTTRGQDLNYGATTRGQDMNYGTTTRGQDMDYNLGAGRLAMEGQNQMFNQALQVSNLAANPRNLTQSLMMLGMSPDAANQLLRSTPYTQAWMNDPNSLDHQPYVSAVPFSYQDGDMPMAFLPAGNAERDHNFAGNFLPNAQFPTEQYPTQQYPTNQYPTQQFTQGGSTPPPTYAQPPVNWQTPVGSGPSGYNGGSYYNGSSGSQAPAPVLPGAPTTPTAPQLPPSSAPGMVDSVYSPPSIVTSGFGGSGYPTPPQTGSGVIPQNLLYSNVTNYRR